MSKEVEERLARYSRLLDNKDFTETIDELVKEFGLNGSVLPLCNLPNATQALFAREGMRTFVNKLLGLKDEMEQQLPEKESEINE